MMSYLKEMTLGWLSYDFLLEKEMLSGWLSHDVLLEGDDIGVVRP